MPNPERIFSDKEGKQILHLLIEERVSMHAISKKLNCGVYKIVQFLESKGIPKEEAKKYKKRLPNTPIKKVMMDVKCPQCEKIYKRNMKDWTGNGMPRIRCDTCTLPQCAGGLYNGTGEATRMSTRIC